MASKDEAMIRELRVAGDWARCWSDLTVTVTPRDGGAPIGRSGPVRSIFRREPDGRWVLARDANMLTAEPPPASRADAPGDRAP